MGWDRVVKIVCDAAGVETVTLPDGLRLRDTTTHRFAFNYAPVAIEWGETVIPPAGVLWWPRET